LGSNAHFVSHTVLLIFAPTIVPKWDPIGATKSTRKNVEISTKNQ